MSKKFNSPGTLRKAQVTINNPINHGLDHRTIKAKLASLKTLTYWCMCDETGDKGTPHTHIFLMFNNSQRFSTLQNLFNKAAHIEAANGTADENIAYVTKIGKWADTAKAHGNHPETFEENGKRPPPEQKQGRRTDLENAYAMIKTGASNGEILAQYPNMMTRIDSLDKTRQTILYERYRNERRDVEVTYIFGETGKGKTRGVMEKYGYDHVYRITDYDHPFDGYMMEDVVIFEEFRSSLKVEQMLNFLDCYPLQLPCRYNNKVACYHKVYIITNIPLYEQFERVQDKHAETWAAFLRRITHVTEYTETSVIEYTRVSSYKKAHPQFPF